MPELIDGKSYLVWDQEHDPPEICLYEDTDEYGDKVNLLICGDWEYNPDECHRIILLDDMLAAWKERQAANRALAACVEAMEKASQILNPDAAFVDTAMFEAGVALDEALAKATAVMKENGNG